MRAHYCWHSASFFYTNTSEMHKLVTSMHTRCIKTKRCGCRAQPTVSMVTGIKKKKKKTCVHMQSFGKIFWPAGIRKYTIEPEIYTGSLILEPLVLFQTLILAVYFSVAQISPHSTNYVFSLSFEQSRTNCCIPFHNLLLLLLVDRLKQKKTPDQNPIKPTQGWGHTHTLMWLDWKCCVYFHQS